MICDPGESPHWSSLCLKDSTLWEGPTLKEFKKNHNSWEGLSLEKFVEDCLTWERPHAVAGEVCGEEGEAEKMCDSVIATPNPLLLYHCSKGGRENLKLHPGGREGNGGRCFLRFDFIPHYPTLT